MLKVSGLMALALISVSQTCSNAVAQYEETYILIESTPVRQELKVSDGQARQLDALIVEYRNREVERLNKLLELPEDQRGPKIVGLLTLSNEELRRSLVGVLKLDQIRRLEQIQLQQHASFVMGKHPYDSKLMLTIEQRNIISKINESLLKSSSQILHSVPYDRDGIMRIRKHAYKQAISVLTDEQKAKWRDLTGKPYKW